MYNFFADSLDTRFPKFGVVNRDKEMDQGDPGIMDRQEFFKMTDPAVWKLTPFSNGLGNMDDGIIFPGHCQSRGKKENKKKGFMFKVLSFFFFKLISVGI